MNNEPDSGAIAAQNEEFNRNLRNLPRRTRPWFENSLPFEYRGPRAPQNIIKTRNIAIIALSIQVASTVAGFSFYFIRENTIYLIANGISILTLANGWWGVVYLNRWNTAIHGVLTSAVFGVFFLYSVLEALIRDDLTDGGPMSSSERTTYVLLALPYLIDFVAGCTTFYLTFLLFREQELKDAERERVEREQNEPDILLPENYDESNDKCCICMNKKKCTVIYPCGHRILCFECAQILKTRHNKKCPFCRKTMVDIIPIYD